MRKIYGIVISVFLSSCGMIPSNDPSFLEYRQSKKQVCITEEECEQVHQKMKMANTDTLSYFESNSKIKVIKYKTIKGE